MSYICLLEYNTKWYMIIFKLAWKLLEDRKLLVNFKVNTNLKFKFLYNLWFENFKNYINVLIKKIIKKLYFSTELKPNFKFLNLLLMLVTKTSSFLEKFKKL